MGQRGPAPKPAELQIQEVEAAQEAAAARERALLLAERERDIAAGEAAEAAGWTAHRVPADRASKAARAPR
ncbi:MAG TPA: hypothetical protein PKC03_15230 [Dokdonella sp.]|jgi:hypothetical protein|nr:hypothetical protein [Dokdonella sp.]